MFQGAGLAVFADGNLAWLGQIFDSVLSRPSTPFPGRERRLPATRAHRSCGEPCNMSCRGLEPKKVAPAMRFKISLFSAEKEIVKQTFRIQAALASTILFAVWLSGCGKESTAEAIAAGNAAPVSEVDLMINDYEKVTNQYVRMARKLKGGDMSVTVPYIELGKESQISSAKLQQIAAKMTPEQAQRVASISARAAPYMHE